MILTPQPPAFLVRDWMARHRHPISFALHMIGIPPTVLGLLLIPVYVSQLSVPTFLLALTFFVGGYLTQFLGHAIDGTEPGEIMILRKKLGWNYPKIAPACPPTQVGKA